MQETLRVVRGDRSIQTAEAKRRDSAVDSESLLNYDLEANDF